MSIKELKVLLFDEISNDFNKNKDAYMFYLYPLIFRIKTNQFNDKCYKIFSKIKKEKVKKFDIYKIKNYLKNDYCYDIKTILKVLFQSSYLTKNNEYALFYIKKLMKKPSTMNNINLIYCLLSNVKDNKTGGEGFVDRVKSSLSAFLSKKPELNEKVSLPSLNSSKKSYQEMSMDEINKFDNKKILNIIIIFMTYILKAELSDIEGLERNTNSINKNRKNLFILHLNDNKEIINHDIKMHNILLEFFDNLIQIINKNYITNIVNSKDLHIKNDTAYTTIIIDNRNIKFFNKIKELYFEFIDLLKLNNIDFKHFYEEDVDTDINLYTQKQKEIKEIKERQERERQERERQEREAIKARQEGERQERERQEREARERQEREAKERQEREARERQEREARERQEREREAIKATQEREARERQEREARERQEREARERQERERQEREANDNIEINKNIVYQFIESNDNLNYKLYEIKNDDAQYFNDIVKIINDNTENKIQRINEYAINYFIKKINEIVKINEYIITHDILLRILNDRNYKSYSYTYQLEKSINADFKNTRMDIFIKGAIIRAFDTIIRQNNSNTITSLTLNNIKLIYNELNNTISNSKMYGGGKKAIMQNHKLKYLLKKIYKNIKTLSLN